MSLEIPRDPKFWRSATEVATALGAFLVDFRRYQFRETHVVGVMAAQLTRIDVFSLTDGRIHVSVSVENDEEEMIRVLGPCALSDLEMIVQAAERGEEAA